MTDIELEKIRSRARAMRYKRPICKDLCIEHIRYGLSDMMEEAGEIDNMLWDDTELEELLGSEEEAYEFKVAFRDLQNDLERMQDTMERVGDMLYLDDEEAESTFDIFFPAMGTDDLMGYDAYEEDYVDLCGWEANAAQEEVRKKLKRYTKDQLLDIAGACLRIARQYIALQYRHDCLAAAFDIIRGKQEGLLQLIRNIEEAYEKAEKASDGFRYKYMTEVEDLTRAVSCLPDKVWIG